MRLQKEEQLRTYIIGKDRQKMEEEKIRSIALVEKAKIKVETKAKIKAEKEVKKARMKAETAEKKRLKNIASVLGKYKKKQNKI